MNRSSIFGTLAFLSVFHQVRRDIADHAFHRAVPGVNDDALRLGDRGIDSAHFAHVNKTIVIDVIHRHGDFVRVGGEHDAGRTAFVQNRHAIAVSIGKRFVRKLLDVIEPDPLAAGFVPGWAGCIDERFEKIRVIVRAWPKYDSSRAQNSKFKVRLDGFSPFDVSASLPLLLTAACRVSRSKISVESS